MPYEIHHGVFSDDVYGYYSAIDKNRIINRSSSRCNYPISEKDRKSIEKKRNELRKGRGFGCPLDKPYSPLGNIDTVFNLKVKKIGGKVIEEDPVELPPSPPTSPEITESIYSPKKTDEKSVGYLAIKERVKNSEKILKNIQTGKSYFNYIKSNKIEDELKFVSKNMCSNKVVPKPPTPKPLNERLKKKFHKIDSQYEMNIINNENYNEGNENESNDKNDDNSSIFSSSFLHYMNSPRHLPSSSPIHNRNKINTTTTTTYNNNNSNKRNNSKRKRKSDKNKNDNKKKDKDIPQLPSISSIRTPLTDRSYNNNDNSLVDKVYTPLTSREKEKKDIFNNNQKMKLPKYVFKSTVPTSNSDLSKFPEISNININEALKSERTTPIPSFDSVSKIPSNLDPIHNLKKLCRDFKLYETKAQEKLILKINLMDFHRTEQIYNKYSSFKVVSNTMNDDLELMRLSAEEKSIKERIKNIENNIWYIDLINKAQDISPELLTPIKRFLLCIQQIVENGVKFTPSLFYYIQLYILSDEDMKCNELVVLLEYVRKNILFLDVKEYSSFLEKHHLQIPKTLQSDLITLSYLEQSRNKREKK